MRTAALLVVAGVLTGQAEATAIASVKESIWQADFAYYIDPVSSNHLTALPGGVTIVCTGTAYADGAGGCMDRRSASVSSSNGTLISQTVDVLGGIQLHNGAAMDYGGTFVFHTKYSSFNPGGPDFGSSVDDSSSEYASFFAVISGPGAFDLHGCNLSKGGGTGSGGGRTCGVAAPDFSWGQAVLGPLASGQTADADYNIYINVAAQGTDPVPEPATIGMFAAGWLGARRMLRRQRPETRLPG